MELRAEVPVRRVSQQGFVPAQGCRVGAMRKKVLELQSSYISLSPSLRLFYLHSCIWVLLEASKSKVVSGYLWRLVNIRLCLFIHGNFAWHIGRDIQRKIWGRSSGLLSTQ